MMEIVWIAVYEMLSLMLTGIANEILQSQFATRGTVKTESTRENRGAQ